jgi:hypothetical protein
LELLYILAFTMPFVLGAGAAGLFRARSRALNMSIILFVAAGCFAAEYFLYDATGFPHGCDGLPEIGARRLRSRCLL